MRLPLPRRFTIQEYLTIERKAETKSEFHKGAILDRTGRSPDHCFISANVGGALWAQLKGAREYRLLDCGQRVAVADGESIFYPDLSGVCGEYKLFAHYRDVISNPALVVEVLSRATSGYDRFVKTPLYQQTPSVNDILLVRDDRAQIEHLSRVGSKWKKTNYTGVSAAIELPRLNCSLPLADIYSNVKL